MYREKKNQLHKPVNDVYDFQLRLPAPRQHVTPGLFANYSDMLLEQNPLLLCYSLKVFNFIILHSWKSKLSINM